MRTPFSRPPRSSSQTSLLCRQRQKNFIRKCLCYRKDERMDVRLMFQEVYLCPPVSKAAAKKEQQMQQQQAQQQQQQQQPVGIAGGNSFFQQALYSQTSDS